jgi:hypothetical protein
MPIWLSFYHPAVVAYFILTFNVYFFYKSFMATVLSTWSYFKLQKLSKIDWLKLSKKLSGFKHLHHIVLIANYKEGQEKVDKTLEILSQQDYPVKRIFVILAMEEREGQQARDRAEFLIKKYKNIFGLISATFHPQLKNEVIGKASNSAWAARYATKIIKEKKMNLDYVTITSCDADSLMPKKYFSYLSYLFLSDKDRFFHFYWAPVLLYSNFWEIPLPIRIQATISSISRLAALSKPDNLIQISTYSASLKMIEKIGYWDTDIIPEDWHVFLQAFFKLGEKVKTIPIYLIITRDAVNNRSILKTFKSRYEQEKRWAWGITDVPYAIYKFFTTPHIPIVPKFFRVLFVIETHLLWPIAFFILTVSASIPGLINPNFARTALGHNLPKLSGFILTITTAFLLILITLDAKSRPKRPANYSIAKTPLLIFQWFLLPIVSFFFSSLPALEAHTRLMIGKRLEYKVTEKI